MPYSFQIIHTSDVDVQLCRVIQTYLTLFSRLFRFGVSREPRARIEIDPMESENHQLGAYLNFLGDTVFQNGGRGPRHNFEVI